MSNTSSRGVSGCSNASSRVLLRCRFVGRVYKKQSDYRLTSEPQRSGVKGTATSSSEPVASQVPAKPTRVCSTKSALHNSRPAVAPAPPRVYLESDGKGQVPMEVLDEAGVNWGSCRCGRRVGHQNHLRGRHTAAAHHYNRILPVNASVANPRTGNTSHPQLTQAQTPSRHNACTGPSHRQGYSSNQLWLKTHIACYQGPHSTG